MADGTVVANGDTCETDLDLQAMFPNKFEVVDGKPAAQAAAAKPAPAPAAKPAPAPAPKKAPAADATDVSGDFEQAIDYDVRVLKDRRGWWVLDGDELLNTSGPLKKGGVSTFIERTFEE